MIHKIYINQFKSIKTNTVIELKPLTFLCGPNSAGKSLLHKVLDFFRNWHEKKLNVFAEKFKTQQKGIDQHFSIGIELISSCYGNIPWHIGMRADDPRLASLYEIRDEQTSIDAADPYVLRSFFEYLEAEKIPIKIMVKENRGHFESGVSHDLELYFDSKIFFRVDNTMQTFFDMHLNKCETDITGPDGQPCWLEGYLEINKKHPLFDKFFSNNMWDVSGHKESGPSLESLLVEESDDKIILRQVGFDMINGVRHVSSIVDMHNIDDFIEIFQLREKGSPNFMRFSELTKYKRWFGDYTLNVDDELFSGDTKLINDINKIFKHLSFAIQHALSYQHIPGSRGLIDSKRGFSENLVIKQEGSEENIMNIAQPPAIDEIFTRFGGELLSYKRIDQKRKKDLRSDPKMSKSKWDKINLSAITLRLRGLANKIITNYLPTLQDYRINEDLKVFGKGYVYYPMVYSKNAGRKLSFNQVGSGISCITPILCAFEVSCRNLIIEQPELHLHPKSQCEIADGFIVAMNNHSIDKAIIETHSENLFLRISRRIRETTYEKHVKEDLSLEPEDVVIYYFEPLKKGHTEIHKIRFDKDGEFLDKWPDGFFAERQDEYPDEWWDEKPTKK